MKRYKPLFEKRRNPEQNPFVGAWDYVEKYKDDPDVYISFTEVNKIGINPQSQYNTPIGIYCYPLKEFVKLYISEGLSSSDVAHDNIQTMKYSKKIGDVAPFAGGAKYVNFLKLKDKSNFINDMYSDYGSNDYDRDIKILEKKYVEKIHDKFLNKNFKVHTYSIFDRNFSDINKQLHSIWEQFVVQVMDFAKQDNPVIHIWYLTHVLAQELSSSKKQASVKWNLILSKDLGYSGFADKSGKGYIHPSEHMQAVFLRKNAFKVITREKNVPAKRKQNPLEYYLDNPKEVTKLSPVEFMKLGGYSYPLYQKLIRKMDKLNIYPDGMNREDF